MKNGVQKIVYKGVSIQILRLDLLHPKIQGNKYFKLKYNIEEAKINHSKNIITFGGEYSNHIHATSLACKINSLNSIGIIRGDKTTPLNHTLSESNKNGMELFFVSRTIYRELRKLVSANLLNKVDDLLKENKIEIDIKNSYIIPEGGTNALAIKGTSEILQNIDIDYKTVCIPIGSCGTIAGIISKLKDGKKVLGFTSLKGIFFEKEIERLIKEYSLGSNNHWEINHDYHFGGFAAFDDSLIAFINNFSKKYKIPTCPLYTGKMFYGIFDLIDKEELIDNDKILAIHTGGLQGIVGFNEKNNHILKI